MTQPTESVAAGVSVAWGVALIVVGLAAMVGFAYAKVPEGSTAAGIVTLGVAIVWARVHQSTKTALQSTRVELTELRASMRPPSLVDATEKKG
jgi:hypothetical protein